MTDENTEVKGVGTQFHVEHLLDRVQARLGALGMTQKEMAAATDANHRTVEGWFAGRAASLPAAWVTKAAPVLGVNVLWLLTGEGPMLPEGESGYGARVEAIRRIASNEVAPELINLLAGEPDPAILKAAREVAKQVATPRPEESKKANGNGA